MTSWSPQQDAALAAVREWLNTPRAPQCFRLFGYAGTGKTTIAKELGSLVKGTVLFAAFTGKAALQLRKKGCIGASTIHSLIYKAETNRKTGEVTFRLNPDSELSDAKLLVVDEVSMVGEELAKDLLSFGVRILVLGDPAQLPPVKDEGYFINAGPDAMLTEVHRQALENPIIRMSMEVREGRRLQLGEYGNSRVIARQSIGREELGALVLEADQVICGLNRTRQNFNRRVRSLKGLYGHAREWHPVVGDRLICLRNNREQHLFNGGIWSADDVFDTGGWFKLRLCSLDEDRAPVRVKVREEFFAGTEGDLTWVERGKSDQFTFGWAITCHKSQGSEWDNVIVFDESGAFRDARRNWAYTAITRAAERLTFVM